MLLHYKALNQLFKTFIRSNKGINSAKFTFPTENLAIDKVEVISTLPTVWLPGPDQINPGQ
jgi:hypothetical protein